MGKYVPIRNGMTNAEEADILFMSNQFLYQEGVIDSSSLAVTQRSAGANMSVDVAGGRGYIGNDSFTTNSADETKLWPIISDATANVTITSNSSGNPRIDIIVAKLNSGLTPDANASNIFTIEAVVGTPAASPSAPATPTNSFKLAEIAVASGATSIVTANITDSRPYALPYVPTGNSVLFTASSDDETYMYAGTNKSGTPTGDGWRMRWDSDYLGGGRDYFIFEKTDGNATSPDGGFIFLLTGNDGVEEESLEIAGDGTVIIHDGNALYIKDSTDTSIFSALFSGANFILGNTAGNIHVYDSVIDVHLRIYSHLGGSDFLDLYQSGTASVVSAQSGNLNLVATGDITLAPSGGDVFITEGAKLNMRNPADTLEWQLYMDASNNFWLDPAANGEVFIISSFIRRNYTTTAYEDSFEQEGWGYINGDGSRAVTAGFTLGKAYSAASWILCVSPAGEKVGVPATSNDGNATGVFGMLGIPTAASTFNITYFKTDAAGTTTAGTYGIFHFLARGPI